MRFILFCVSTLFLPSQASRCVEEVGERQGKIVETNLGMVVGKRDTAIDPRQNKTVGWTSYYDIPYAKPPLGDLRFHAPVPAEPWRCVRDASFTEDKICPQININLTLAGLVNGGLDEASNEDCLYLNVYVPDTDTPDTLPVLFWIHGGGYVSGSGRSHEYGPLYYLSHQIIVVAIRYRLGPLGFLSLGTEDVPGNAGVRDQVMALQWVSQNIQEFGGDTDQVTVHGQSAGSFSSTYHLFSPLTRGLFHRVILQSGPGGFSPSYHHFGADRAAKYGKLAAAELGCLDLSLEKTANCLREKSVVSLLAVDFVNELMSHPSIDSDHMSEPYLPMEPLNAIMSGEYANDVDVMIGFNEDEALIGTEWLYAAPDLFDVAKELWNILGPYALLQKHTSEITEDDIQFTKEILNFYCGPLENLNFDHFENFTKMTSDSFFWFGTNRFIDLHIEQSYGNTFFYRFKYYGEYHAHSGAPGNNHYPGVSHSDELVLQWNPLGRDHPLNQEDAEVSLALTTMWTNFVKHGHPTPLDQELGYTWSPVTPGNKEYLLIDQTMQMDLDQDYKHRMNFWDSIWPRDKPV